MQIFFRNAQAAHDVASGSRSIQHGTRPADEEGHIRQVIPVGVRHQDEIRPGDQIFFHLFRNGYLFRAAADVGIDHE